MEDVDETPLAVAVFSDGREQLMLEYELRDKVERLRRDAAWHDEHPECEGDPEYLRYLADELEWAVDFGTLDDQLLKYVEDALDEYPVVGWHGPNPILGLRPTVRALCRIDARRVRVRRSVWVGRPRTRRRERRGARRAPPARPDEPSRPDVALPEAA
jgi:hypothetical protein